MTAVVLFTRDLRIHDNPALHAATGGGERVVPLFVLDDGILGGGFNRPNRARFLAGALADLDASLRERGGGLVVRRGDVVEETARVAAAVGADVVHVAGDASRYAVRRAERLSKRLADDGRELEVHDDALFVVPPGRVTASGKDHMAVFTPYHRRWLQVPRRKPFGAPRTVEVPRVPGGRGAVPSGADICDGEVSPELPEGGETAGRARMAAFLRDDAAGYPDGHDDLAGDVTSRLSPYLHFGCVSPLELVTPGRRRTRASSARWPGATSTPRCSRRDRTPSATTSAPAGTGGGARRRTSPHGRPAAPGCRWWTPACASCCARGGCTTGRGSSSGTSS